MAKFYRDGVPQGDRETLYIARVNQNHFVPLLRSRQRGGEGPRPGEGGELHTHPTPHPPTPPPSLLSVLRTGVWVRVRGVRFAWRSFPNGLYQKKAKIDLGVS